MKQDEIIEESIDNYSEPFYILALTNAFNNLSQALHFQVRPNVLDITVKWKLVYKSFDKEFQLLWKDLKVPADTVGKIIHKSTFRMLVFFNAIPDILLRLLILIRQKEMGMYPSQKEFDDAFKVHISTSITNLFSTFDYTLGFVGLNIRKLEKAKKFLGKSILKVEEAAHKKVLDLYNKDIEEKKETTYSKIARYIARTELGFEYKSEQDKYYNRFIYWKNNKDE